MQRLVLLSLLASLSFGQNPDCTVVVPANPLTATGLSTPYLLAGLNAATAGPCNQANDGQTSFAEAVIYDGQAQNLAAYHPLVIDVGTKALINPVVPQIPAGAVIGIWFGTNANTITLLDNGAGSLSAGQCVNGVNVNGQLSVFGQYAYCNAVTFFAIVNAAVMSGAVVAPPLGIASDGEACPTVRDFSLVDMDPGDNVVTTYLINPNTGQAAQNTTANLQTLGVANVVFISNPSDNRLITAVDTAIGCAPWKIRNLDDVLNLGGVATLATNELHGLKWQKDPIAYIPLTDPMARVNNQPNLMKVNAYRAGLGQPAAGSVNAAAGIDFCTSFYKIHPRRLLKNFKTLINFPSPTVTVADSLFTFLAQRFFQAFGRNNLNCIDILGVNNPVNLTVNADGVIVGAIIVPPTDGMNTVMTPPARVTVPTPNAATGLSINAALLACLFAALVRLF
jgi:hypothetical protein